jgi:hypothetical protein
LLLDSLPERKRMNSPTVSPFKPLTISPRSLGYSYMPGAVLATATPTPPVATFGTSASPVSPTRLLPILTVPNQNPIGVAPIANPVRGTNGVNIPIPVIGAGNGQPTANPVTGGPTLRTIGVSLGSPVAAQPILTRVTNGLFA